MSTHTVADPSPPASTVIRAKLAVPPVPERRVERARLERGVAKLIREHAPPTPQQLGNTQLPRRRNSLYKHPRSRSSLNVFNFPRALKSRQTPPFPSR